MPRRIVQLGWVCEFQNGRSFKKSEWRSSGLPIIRIQNLNNKDAQFNHFLGEYDDRIEVNDGDLLFSWSGTVGSSFGPHIWDRGKGVLNQHIFRVSLDECLDDRYAYYSLREITAEIEKGVNGAVGLVHITKTKLKTFKIPLPPLSEQKRIVAILDKAFAAIAMATANAEKNLASARELFGSHLQALITQRGKGWTEKLLSEVSELFGRGKSRHRPRNEPSLYGGPYPFIQTGDISQADHWLNQYSQTYSAIGLAQSRLWPRGTICIAIVGATVGETAILDFEACFPDSVIGIVVNDEMAENEYVEYVLQAFKVHLKEKGKGTARDNINVGTFEDERFPFPPLKQQKEIVATLNRLREDTQNLASIYQRKLTAIAELKQSLLHKAFTGELATGSEKIIDRTLPSVAVQ